MSWVPQDDGSTLCEEHGERFRAPVTCSKCDGAASAIEVVTTEAELLDERAAEMDLGDELDDPAAGPSPAEAEHALAPHTAAALARERRRTAHEELTSQYATASLPLAA